MEPPRPSTQGSARRLLAPAHDQLGRQGPGGRSHRPLRATDNRADGAVGPADAAPQSRGTWAWRFHAVRLFARHRALSDPQTEVPPAGLLGPTFRRGHPHIYSAAEITAFLAAARTLRPGLRPHTYVALFGLLITTGLRIGEALGLCQADVDLRAGTADDPQGQGGAIAARPPASLDDRGVAPLREGARPPCMSGDGPTAFFVTVRGTALTYQWVTKTFRTLRRQLGWATTPRAGAPRLHDFRHTFAVSVLLHWYQTGADIDAHIATLATYLGHVNVTYTYWYSDGGSRADGDRGEPLRDVRRVGRALMTATPTFPTLLQDFFHQHLLAQRQASPRTVASYRDAFRLLLTYAHDRLHKPPSAVTLADLDAPLLLAFLDHLEGTRHNGARTRNARLAALRSFLHYASVRDPTALAVIQRALAIPTKRFDRPLLGFLSRAEIDALLAAPDRSTWSGHRDHVLFTTLYNTGARVSEIIGVRVADLVLEPVAHVRLHGKGRKDRTVPLWKSTAKRLKEWLPRVKAGPDTPLFPNGRGVALSRSGVERRLRAAVTRASVGVPHSRPNGSRRIPFGTMPGPGLCRAKGGSRRSRTEMAPETEVAIRDRSA